MPTLPVSIAEAAYLLYMYNIFKTTKNFENKQSLLCKHPGDDWTHETGDSDVPTNKICPNGKKLSYVGAAYLIGRHWRYNKTLNYVILGAGLIGAFVLNKNAFVYLLPILGVELII